MATMTELKVRARTATREARARDAAAAMREYEARKAAELAKTERLRALRLARDAAGLAPATPKRVVKRAPRK